MVHLRDHHYRQHDRAQDQRRDSPQVKGRRQSDAVQAPCGIWFYRDQERSGEGIAGDLLGSEAAKHYDSALSLMKVAGEEAMNAGPSSEIIWALDCNPGYLHCLAQDVAKRLPAMTLEMFDDRDKAVDALRRTPPERYPWLIVHDYGSVAKPSGQGPAFRQLARRQTPLTLDGLYSDSAYQIEGEVPRLLREQEVYFAIHKGYLASLLDRILTYHDRWSLPLLEKLRQYIATSASPKVPFATCGDGKEVGGRTFNRETSLKPSTGGA